MKWIPAITLSNITSFFSSTNKFKNVVPPASKEVIVALSKLFFKKVLQSVDDVVNWVINVTKQIEAATEKEFIPINKIINTAVAIIKDQKKSIAALFKLIVPFIPNKYLSNVSRI